MLSQVLANTSTVDAVFGGHLLDGHSGPVVSDELCGLITPDLVEVPGDGRLDTLDHWPGFDLMHQ